MTVIQFPGPREGLTDCHVQAVIAWCASEGSKEAIPVVGCSEDGAVSVSILRDDDEVRFHVARQEGQIGLLDGNFEEVPRGTSRAADRLMETLSREG